MSSLERHQVHVVCGHFQHALFGKEALAEKGLSHLMLRHVSPDVHQRLQGSISQSSLPGEYLTNVFSTPAAVQVYGERLLPGQQDSTLFRRLTQETWTGGVHTIHWPWHFMPWPCVGPFVCLLTTRISGDFAFDCVVLLPRDVVQGCLVVPLQLLRLL